MQQRPVFHGTGLELDPELAAFAGFWSVILALDTVLTPQARDACPACSAAGRLVDERLCARPPAGLPRPHVPDGMTADGAAAVIAAQLARGAIPATTVFAALTSREITLRVIGPPMRGGMYVRNGLLQAGTVICARTTAELDRAAVRRLASASAWDRITAGEPAGYVLAPRGMVPGRRVIELAPGGDPAVRARRELLLGAEVIGTVTEEVPLDFCQRLADPGR
jgi:hypothetical protein